MAYRPVRNSLLRQDVIAIGQVNVEIAVVVKIEKGRTTGSDGREVKLVDGARLMHEVQPDLISDVGEPLGLCSGGRFGAGRSRISWPAVATTNTEHCTAKE
jgi:hypothetical protein